MVVPNLSIDSETIADFCRRHHIKRLGFFGSVLRDDFRPDSDVDLLVEFEEGHSPGWYIVDLEAEFGRLVGGRKVQILDPKYLNRRIRDGILRDERVAYGQILVPSNIC